MPDEDVDDAGAMYLDLLKRCLTRSLDAEGDEPWEPRPALAPLVRWLNGRLSARRVELVRRTRLDPEVRRTGKDWPWRAETMIGLDRLDNIEACVRDAVRDGVPGDLVETGVWRGGAVIFMAAVLRVLKDTARRVWAADSFRGLPPPDAARYPADWGDTYHTYRALAVSGGTVRANFERYGLLDERVRFLEGWFKDTLPGAPIDKVAVLRLDGDMYKSTMDALRPLYPKLSAGGFCIVDDYRLETCRAAVTDYRREHAITEPIVPIDDDAVFWRRDRSR
jgi:O-methyltransferase